MGMDFKKMFRVIVAGGFTIVSTTTAVTGCGDETDDSPPAVDSGFPMEGPPPPPPDAGRMDSGMSSDDAGTTDAGTDSGFPMEGPMMIDGGG